MKTHDTIPRFLMLLAAAFLSCSCAKTDSTLTAGGKDTAGTNLVFAEEDFTAHSGLLTQPQEEYLKMEQAKMTRSFTDEPEALYKDLPGAVDLSAKLPQAGDQGKQNSCTAWALAYAVKSFQENREHGWGLDETHLFSPAFIYNQINNGNDLGADLADAMEFLQVHGTAPLAMMAYDENDFRSQPDDQLKSLAKGFRALGYRRIDEKNVALIKSYLAAGEPVIIVLEMYKNFLKSGMIRAKNVYRERIGDSLGHHALVAVGYDNAKSAIKLLNSWGTRWGENGYGWIDEKFFPEVVKRAYLLYDTPTTQKSLAALQGPGPKPEEKLVAGTTAPDEKFLMIVPNEAGIVCANSWLRLGEALTKTRDFFSEKTAPAFKDFNFDGDAIVAAHDFLSPDEIGFIHFNSAARLPVLTNQGIGFGSARQDVHRVYQRPDHHNRESNTDTYFFHAVTDDWGGIKVTRHASLAFQYDEQDKVIYMGLGRVMKKSITGESAQKPPAQGQQITQEGTVIESKEGRIRFAIPKQFSDINKSEWEGTGFGYFAKNPDNIAEFLAVKVFFTDKPVTAQMLSDRIAADLKTHQLSGLTPKTESFAGIDWQVVAQDEKNLHYYGAKGNIIYQIQMASDEKLKEQGWLQNFKNSLTVL